MNIDTKFRKNYYSTKSTNFSIHLPYTLKNVISVRLASFELVNRHIVAISELHGTNHFTIKKIRTDNVSDFNSKKVSLDGGNYSIGEIETEINLQLSDLSNVTIEIDRITGKTTIETTDNEFFIEIDFSNTTKKSNISENYKTSEFNKNSRDPDRSGARPPRKDLANKLCRDDSCLDDPAPPSPSEYFDNMLIPPVRTLGWLMGFRKRVFKGKKKYTSSGKYDLFGDKYIFICLEDYHRHAFDIVNVVEEQSFKSNNILAKFII